MRIVQLSDLHLRPGLLYSGLDPWACLAGALARAAALRPDCLLLSGDLADDAAPATYARLAGELAAAGLPYAVLPGNHDERAALRAAFPGQAWSHPELACQRVAVGDVILLLLDSVVAGEEGGAVGPAHLAWLTQQCPAAGRVVLALHHPPFAIGVPGMDAIACRGEGRLAAWLADRPQVEAVLCGHVHRHVTTSFAGRPAQTAPATVHQIALQEGPLAYTLEAGGLLVHDLLPSLPMRTHYLPLAAAPVHVYTD